MCIPLATFHVNAISPKLKFQHLNVENGLSQSTVRSIVRDSQGFLWIGTSDGLNRYDGYKIEIYQHDYEDDSTISRGVVKVLYNDSKGTLWIGTYGGGLNRFDAEKQHFIHYRHDAEDPNSISNDLITAIEEDSMGRLWVGTREGLNLLERSTGKFTRYLSDESSLGSITNNDINVIFEDEQKVLWVGTQGGLNKLQENRNGFVHYRGTGGIHDGLTHDEVHALEEDRHGALWIGTGDGILNRLDKTRQQIIHIGPKLKNSKYKFDKPVTDILESNDGKLWFGHGYGGGVARFDITDYESSFEDVGIETYLPKAGLLTIYQDNQGLIWFGTTTSGAIYINPVTEHFNHYQMKKGDTESLNSSATKAIFEDSNKMLWVGTYDGILYQFDKKHGQVNQYRHITGDPASLTKGVIKAIHEDSQGAIWIATYYGLNRFNRITKQFDRFLPNSTGPNINFGRIFAIHEDKQGMLWLGTEEGLIQFDPILKHFKHYRHITESNNSLVNNHVSAVIQDQLGNIWAGTSNGVSKLDPKSGHFQHYQHSSNNPNSLSSNLISALLEDESGNIWIGTQRGGLNRLNLVSNTISHYRVKEGLANNMVNAILDDDDGNLWISTNRGLSKLVPATHQFTNYTAEDGLQSNEFNMGAKFKSKGGELFFGGVNGFNRFYPSQIHHDPLAPKLAFTNLLIFNEPYSIEKDNQPEDKASVNTKKNPNIVLSKSINTTEELVLSYQQRHFSLEFTALNFISPKRNQYAYKLEGWDKNWISTNYQNRLATYNNILPGQYKLNVKAANKDGIWNDQGISMAITILPPWWATFQLKVIYALFGMLVLLLMLYRLTIIPRKRAKLLEIQIQERTVEIKQKSDHIQQLLEQNIQFSQNISHSLKTPLNLILGPVERMLKKDVIHHEEIQRLRRNALRLKKDIDTLVTFSRLSDAMPIVKSYCDIGHMAKALITDFRQAFEHKQIQLTLRNEPNLLFFGEPDAVEKVLVNLLENALKYTPSLGQVDVDIQGTGNRIKILVADTGAGIATENQQYIFKRGARLSSTQNQPGSGIGLAFVKDILHRNAGSIEVKSQLGAGSHFIVTLPRYVNDSHTLDKKVTELSANTKELISDIGEMQQHKQEVGKASHHCMNESNSDSTKPQILVVEDDQEMREYMQESFIDNFRCLQANNGAQGLSLARKHNPDLIISDVMMPIKTGQQMLKELKADPQLSHIPVILVTAAANPIGLEQAKVEGAIHYFAKPYSEQKIIDAVYKALDIQTLNQARIEQCLLGNIPITSHDFHYIEKADIKLLNALATHMHAIYDDPSYTNPIKTLAAEIFFEQRRLRRKLEVFLIVTPAILLRNIRLEKARSLLEKGSKPVKVYEQVGFTSQDYFSKCFKNQYGQTPSEYIKGQSALTIKASSA
ncbi:hybrid sensor histidine kinase/response regulator [Alteromonadaceae bacterium M269]|nr:hybrid sensor histidine kinase/response regulator [Alteromonadaceae bacterium M269]